MDSICLQILTLFTLMCAIHEQSLALVHILVLASLLYMYYYTVNVRTKNGITTQPCTQVLIALQ